MEKKQLKKKRKEQFEKEKKKRKEQFEGGKKKKEEEETSSDLSSLRTVFADILELRFLLNLIRTEE